MTLPTPEQLKELGFRVNPTNDCWMQDFPKERSGDLISQGYLQLIDDPDEEGWTVEIHNGTRNVETGEENVESVCLPQRIHTHAQLVQLVRAVFGPPCDTPEAASNNGDPLSPIARTLLVYQRNEARRELACFMEAQAKRMSAAGEALDALRKTFESVNTCEDDPAEQASIHLLNMIEKASTSLCMLIAGAAGHPSMSGIVFPTPIASPGPSKTDSVAESA